MFGSLQEAYEIGCQGTPFCRILFQNPFFDESTPEFFGPRINTGQFQFEYYVELKGNPPAEVDWTQYVSSVKDQSATTTCYLQVIGTVTEMLMNKRLQEFKDSPNAYKWNH